MNAFVFALRNLVRQPARATLGVLGVAAVGALLLDMLLLSQGLIVSMRSLLDRTGWDVRVTATDDLPGNASRMADPLAAARAMTALPTVRSALALRFADAVVDGPDSRGIDAAFQGAGGSTEYPWQVLSGRDVASRGDAVIDASLASTLEVVPGDTIALRASCTGAEDALPAVRLTVAGVAQFPFQISGEFTVAASLDTLEMACGNNGTSDANLILVKSSGDAGAAAAAIRGIRPDLRARTNEDMVGRMQQSGFTYFQQISAVLTTITLAFAGLLIAVLLTVSVNQRLGEIAALRALGFSRVRVVADVLSESAIIVGAGALLSLPIGLLLASRLDVILKRMPGIPEEMHFFVLQPSAVALHLTLLALTAVVAALYPMRVVSRLPIAGTLRDEVVG